MRVRAFARPRRRNGVALVVVLVLVALLTVLVALNADTVRRTFRELKRVETRQLKSWPILTNQPAAATNTPAR